MTKEQFKITIKETLAKYSTLEPLRVSFYSLNGMKEELRFRTTFPKLWFSNGVFEEIERVFLNSKNDFIRIDIANV